MVFTCRQCGTCCMYLGDYIVIDHQVGPFEFACESVSTGTALSPGLMKTKRRSSAITPSLTSIPMPPGFSVLMGVSCGVPSIVTARHNASSTAV